MVQTCLVEREREKKGSEGGREKERERERERERESHTNPLGEGRGLNQEVCLRGTAWDVLRCEPRCERAGFAAIEQIAVAHRVCR